jgi:3,2-trans-enoyl-CoA isomerase
VDAVRTGASLARRGLCSPPKPPSEASPLIINYKHEGVASISLNNRPVNALSHGVCVELKAAIHELEEDGSTRGLILGSALPNLFSGGLDIRAFHRPDLEKLARYWTSVQEVWLALHTTKLATVAAISGHAPAGGCLLALSCDHRVMVSGGYGIGLNEAQLGITAPPWFSALLADRIGSRRAERMLMTGQLFSPEGALAAGLVDDVTSLAELNNVASSRLAELLAVNERGRVSIKKQLRDPAAEALRERQSEDLDWFIHVVQQEEVQASLGAYIESLKKKGDKE